MKSLTQTQRKIYFVFLSAVALWCGLIILAPLLAWRGHSFSSGINYLIFSPVCHQMASRSFFVFGHQMAVCSRCTGIYFGFFASTLLFFVLIKMKKVPDLSYRVLFLAVIALAIDFAAGFTVVGNTKVSRFFTGFIVGAIALFFVLPGVLELGNSLRKKNRNDSNWR